MEYVAPTVHLMKDVTTRTCDDAVRASQVFLHEAATSVLQLLVPTTCLSILSINDHTHAQAVRCILITPIMSRSICSTQTLEVTDGLGRRVLEQKYTIRKGYLKFLVAHNIENICPSH
jgi:hypothetical protein